MAKPRDTRKYQAVDGNGRIVRSGITRRDLQTREQELRRETGRNLHLRQVGRATTDEAARVWEKRQLRGTPPGGRR